MDSLLEILTTDNKINDLDFSVKIIDTLFKYYPDGIVIKDKYLRHIIANDSFYVDNCIKNPQDAIGKTIDQYTSKETGELLVRLDHEVMKTKQAKSCKLKVSNGTGKIVNVTATPLLNHQKEFIGLIYIGKDITIEENLKDALIEKQKQMEALLDNTPMFIYMKDKDRNFISGNRDAMNFVETGVDNFAGIQVDMPRMLEGTAEEDWYVLKNNKTLEKIKDAYDVNGNTHSYKIYKTPICNDENEVTGMITVAYNVDTYEQLQAQRATFVASLGHDLKNPTIAQIRALNLLLEGSFGEIPEQQKEIITIVLDSCNYMYSMLASMLATYKFDKGEIKLCKDDLSLEEISNECIKEMYYFAKDKEVNLITNFNTNNSVILADKTQLKRVIMNLLSNGIKFAFKETDITISVYFDEKDNICFSFKNNSPYIPLEKQKLLFNKYVSYADLHNEIGVGLGLYSSKKIIEAHGGEIFVKSNKNNETTFGFSIPINSQTLGSNKITF